jgi:hypothetical protein
MSLRDLGVFAPLQPDHPSVGTKCWKCGTVLGPGVRVALCAIETPDQTGSLTVEAKPVCATCHLKGAKIETPKGARIVSRIKEGDGSPFPVETTDGEQWGDDEVGQVPGEMSEP